MPRFSRDMFTNVDVRQAANAAMSTIDTLQNFSPGEQLAGLSAVFKLACERNNVSVPDAMVVVNNIMNHAEGKRPEFRAVEQFMEKEW